MSPSKQMVRENMWLQQTQAKSKTITSCIVSSCSTSCIASTLDISYHLSVKLCWSSERQVVLDISHNLHPLKKIFFGTSFVFQIVLMVFMKEPEFLTQHLTYALKGC